MLKRLKRKRAHELRVVADPTATREDLQVRDLLDDPSLRRALGLDTAKQPTAA